MCITLNLAWVPAGPAGRAEDFAESEISSSLDKAAEPLRILLVDDSAAIREHMLAMVSTIDAAEVVGETDNVARGIELMRRLKPDVVVLDISLFGGNGIDVLIESRNLEVRPTVAIMTNHSYGAYRKICTQLGADYFFDKSKEFNQLRDMLRTFAQRRVPTP